MQAEPKKDGKKDTTENVETNVRTSTIQPTTDQAKRDAEQEKFYQSLTTEGWQKSGGLE